VIPPYKKPRGSLSLPREAGRFSFHYSLLIHALLEFTVGPLCHVRRQELASSSGRRGARSREGPNPLRRPRTRLRHPLREKGSKLGAPSCCRLSPSKEDDDGRPSPSNDNLWPVCRSSIDVFISPEAMVLLVARHIWHEAQERELGWWSGFQDKLTSVDFVERKRLEILQIWANVRRFVDTSVPRVLEIGASFSK